LTVGWEAGAEPTALALDAAGVHAAKNKKKPETRQQAYADAVAKALGKARAVYGLDALWRRRIGEGAQPLKRFLAAVSSIDGADLVCHIDAFNYAFAKHASNIDLLLPETEERPGGFRASHEAAWTERMARLEAYEWEGVEPDPAEKQAYRRLRATMARRSARDERRALATLLVSGPATTEEISEELALGYTLSPRVLAPFADAGVVARRDEDKRYAIVMQHIPPILFALRETMGVDPLGSLRRDA
jgi:hypothetical protein